ncbi:phage integrase N-terminal SAM-like domain-containing protein [Shewanella benthica]|uniref:phage integrase N-terminal SAM-like domain-containing protein n=1 Tax=Shewanella benthica TaxID=43661 RepID=UPI001E3D0CB8|nr:phage integrase N-terminal SAM-like domain-containing protein [Shewanella benthica]
MRHCNIRHGADITPALIEHFLCFLAVQCKVSASTQKQALYAIGFRRKRSAGMMTLRVHITSRSN